MTCLNENNLTVNTGNGADYRRKEVELMLQAGYITVGLGPHRLQAETEIIALLATLVMCDHGLQGGRSNKLKGLQERSRLKLHVRKSTHTLSIHTFPYRFEAQNDAVFIHTRYQSSSFTFLRRRRDLNSQEKGLVIESHADSASREQIDPDQAVGSRSIEVATGGEIRVPLKRRSGKIPCAASVEAYSFCDGVRIVGSEHEDEDCLCRETKTRRRYDDSISAFHCLQTDFNLAMLLNGSLTIISTKIASGIVVVAASIEFF
ncbi:hypothetical protein DY000_02048402 [Brassica cretica]|uniref:Uncharacterized protein n=1 Tax=Brassica cretica TaxID=69181 RepID=A0ABQ7F681_BRACR|nr:hypothetical protein DY000_02048402 [Brassica cretica]